MGRALEPPALLGRLPLEQLQHPLLVAVRGLHVAVGEPVGVRRDVRGHEEDLRLELEGHQVVVLHRPGRRLRQHRAQPRGPCGPAPCRPRCSAPAMPGLVGLRRHAGRRARRLLLPDAEVAERRVLGRAGATARSSRSAGSPTPSSSICTSCSSISGWRAYQSSICSRFTSGRTSDRVERLLAELVELRLGLGRPHEDLEPLAPRVAAEVARAPSAPSPARRRRRSAPRRTRAPPVAVTTDRPGRPGIERSIIPLAVSPSHV